MTDIRKKKFWALVKNFPEIENYSKESFWNFQYLFKDKAHDRGGSKILVDERLPNNSCVIIREGECVISKNESHLPVDEWVHSISSKLL